MARSTKCTRPLTFSGFIVMLILAMSLFKRCRGYSLQEEAQIMASSHFEWGRNLLEGDDTSEPARPLAATVRVDPLNKLKKYRGGYNISNKHYWSSTAFTGKHGYSIAALWLLGGLIYAGFLLTHLFSSDKQWGKAKRLNCSRQCHFWPITLGVLFTLLAIITSGLVLGGNSRFHSKAKMVRNIIIEATEEASEAIYNVTRAIVVMQDNVVGIQDCTGRLNSTVHELNRGAADIQRQAVKNRRWIDKGLKMLFVSTAVVVSLNLIAVLAMSVSGVFRPKRALYLFIALCWFFTIILWLFFGVYYFIEKFASDTCTALVQYQQEPSSSSLSSVLPCDDLLSAKSVLLDAREGTYDLIDEINANISRTPMLDQVRVCNPFSGPPDYRYEPGTCPRDTMQIGDIPQLLGRFACSGGDSRTCRDGEFIPASNFSAIVAYTNSIQNLMNAFPDMESLVNCEMVKDAINDILSKQCKPVKTYIRMVWTGMAALSTIMVVLVLVWTTKAYSDRNNCFFNDSVKPQSAAAAAADISVHDTSITSSGQTVDRLDV